MACPHRFSFGQWVAVFHRDSYRGAQKVHARKYEGSELLGGIGTSKKTQRGTIHPQTTCGGRLKRLPPQDVSSGYLVRQTHGETGLLGTLVRSARMGVFAHNYQNHNPAAQGPSAGKQTPDPGLKPAARLKARGPAGANTATRGPYFPECAPKTRVRTAKASIKHRATDSRSTKQRRSAEPYKRPAPSKGLS